MKRFFAAFWRFLPHLVLILSVMMLTFFVIDQINSSMAFLNNDITKYLLALFSLLSGAVSVYNIVKEEKKH